MKRIVGGHGSSLFAISDQLKRLAVRGGLVETVSYVLALGDGCGCLTAPAWSPDRSEIAYYDGILTTCPCSGAALVASVAVMNADGSDRRDLTTPQELGSGSLSWSPDGKRIAFVGTSGHIEVVNLDGSGSQDIMSGPICYCFDPAWSPDGSKIAFGTDGTSRGIYVMNADGSGAQELTTFAGATVLDGLAWSPDGTRIAYSLNGRLKVMNADGSNRHSLEANAYADEPAWSPDSSQIVFGNGKGLAVINGNGSGLHQLTRGQDFHPSWSPDGKTILFASYRDDPYAKVHESGERAYTELYLVNSGGGNLRPLSFTHPSSLKNQARFHSPTGHPLPVLPGVPALAGNIAAVANTVSGVHQIELFAAATGEQLAVVPVGPANGPFSIVGGDNHWVVFLESRTISALNTQTDNIIRLATTVGNPLDLSVSGRRVAWAENAGGRGRILELELPN